MRKPTPNSTNPTYNSLRYDSIMFPDDWRSNYTFCFSYEIVEGKTGHGKFTHNLDFVYDYFVHQHEFLKVPDVALYNYHASLASMGKRLSQKEVAHYMGEYTGTITDRTDRLQNCLLLHRVFREDIRGGGFDIVIHAPPMIKEATDDYGALIKLRLGENTAKEARLKNLTEEIHTQKLRNGQTVEIARKQPHRGNFVKSFLSFDMREIRALFHGAETRVERIESDYVTDETDAAAKALNIRRNALRRHSQPDEQSEVFIRLVFDAIKAFYLSFKAEPEGRTYRGNQEQFRGILYNWCKNEIRVKGLRDPVKIYFDEQRWHAAFKLAYHYAPGIFQKLQVSY